MYINHNQMSSNVANTLTSHYGNLATSTQRLSSGLRVNSAADDAAGLAIRELMRADIASLNQGVRNANDAISMIQTADGAMGIIDEKLIRMKELAEQAATGTYDSTQRLMIESEYQAMASEITRIANATDFNGMKLLDGTLEGEHDGSGMTATGAMKIHFGTGNDSAEDYYYIEIGEVTAQALGVGNASTWQDVQNRGADAFKKSLTEQIKADKELSDADRAKLLDNVDKAVEQLNAALTNATDYKQAFKYWAAEDGEGFLEAGKEFPGNSSLMADYLTAANAATTAGGPTTSNGIKDKINNAITDAMPVATQVQWATDDTEFAIQANNIWNDVEAAAKKAAQEAGLTDSEIKTLLYGDDGTKGIKAEYENAMGATAPTSQTDGDGKLAAALTQMTITAQANTGVGSVSEFLNSDHADVPGSATYGEVIELRNKAYSEYANAKDDAKPVVGPTSADEIVGKLQMALDDAFKGVDKTKTGDLTNPSGANEEFTKVLDKLVTAAEDLGFTSKEAAAIKKAFTDHVGDLTTTALGFGAANTITATTSEKEWDILQANMGKALAELNGAGQAAPYADFKTAFDNAVTVIGGTKETPAQQVAIRNQGYAAAKANDKLDEFWNGLRDTEKQKLQYAWGQAAMYNLANAETGRDIASYGINASDFDFKTALGLNVNGTTVTDINQTDNDMLANALKAMQTKVGHMDFAGYTIETQEDAQQALTALNDAITQKDKVRAHLGALQNRLENTVSNLTVQAENLQASESRISDVDVATEMTNFVRNQILTQSAVAMLSQANSMPQMAMQLIG